jgi:hypothetical protein
MYLLNKGGWDCDWQYEASERHPSVKVLSDQFINDQANNLANKGAFWHF